MKFRCCDCGEDFNTQSLLEQHISIEHLSWSPYWCLYCKHKGVTLKKATKYALKTHVEKIHPAEQFVFIYEPDDAKEEEHRDKLNRSLALEAEDDTAHHSILSPAPTPVSPSTSPALEPKLEPFEESEFQLPATGSQFSSPAPLSHCLTSGAQTLNDGHLGAPTLMSISKKKCACTVCGKKYTSALPLRMHEDAKMHWGLLKHLTRLQCELCPAKYHFAKGMQLHRKRLHNAEPNTAHHSLLSPAPTLLLPSTSSALEPKLEPFERSEFQLRADSSDTGWQFSSPISDCLSCGAQILNDGHKHECQFPSMHVPVDTDIKQEVGEHTPENSLINSEPTPMPKTSAKKKSKFQCTVCGKEYKQEALRYHEDTKMHWGLLKHLARLKCELCPAKYHGVKYLQLHRKNAHNAGPQPLPPRQKTVACWCRRKFTTECQLLFHEDHHQHHPTSTQKGLRKCPMCSKKYHFKGILQQHMRIHNKGNTKGSQPKPSTNSRNVRFHLRNSLHMHQEMIDDDDQERKEEPSPFARVRKTVKVQCQICNRVFRHEAGLTKHRCPGKPSYRSKLCDQEFDDFVTLDLHRENSNRHETEEPIVPVACPSCNKSFTNKRSLAVHKTKVHSEKKTQFEIWKHHGLCWMWQSVQELEKASASVSQFETRNCTGSNYNIQLLNVPPKVQFHFNHSSSPAIPQE